MRLDKRLSMVANLVRKCDRIADIGTDHAYVPVYLIENEIVKSAYAGDVRQGPLDNAKKTIDERDLSDKIIPILSDGLKNIPHDCHDFIIAGMGGELIAKILSDSPWVEEKDNHFVLQPQTHQEDLRRFLFTNGYEILKEEVVRDGRHLYLAIEAIYNGEKRDFSEADCYIGKVQSTEYIDMVISRLTKKFEATKDPDLEKLISEVKAWQQ